MRGTADGELRVARVLGVPVLLTPSWWLGALVITVAYLPVVRAVLPAASELAVLGLALGMAVLLGVSVLAHELGHCAVALRLGLPVRRVRLFLLGGVSELARPAARPRDEALIAAAGPAVSLVVAAVAGAGALMLQPRTAVWLLAVQLAAANAVVAGFNLLPGLPLDGGRVLRAALWAMTGRRSVGNRGAAAGGVLIGVALVAWALYAIGRDAPAAWLQAGVAVIMAWLVLGSAFAELGRQQPPADPVPLTGLVQPLLQLPAESAIADALHAAAGRGVLLVRADGVAAGLLEPSTAAELAGHAPLAPAGAAAEPVPAEAVLEDRELRADPAGALERVRSTPEQQFLVVDGDGRPVGLLRRADVEAAVHRHRGR